MSDALQSILGDPELQRWPTRIDKSAPATGAAEIDGESGAGTADTGAPDDRDAAIKRMRALIAASDDPPTAFLADISGAGHRDSATARPAAGANSRHDADRADATDSIAGDDAHPAATNSPTTPMSFDDIARRPNHVADKFTAATDWLKDRENWKNPKTLGATAAAIVCVAALGFWATSATAPATESTAQLAAPTAPADPNGARTGPADAAIPVKAATAHCPAPSSDPMNAVRPGSTQPWICVRAWQVDGQILELTLDGPYVITAVRIMPGVNSEVDGQDQWLRYRTVSRLSWSFNDSDHTKVPQVTGDRRELLTQPVAPASCAAQTDSTCRLVASQVVLTIDKTSAPANPNTGPTTVAADPAAGGDYSAFGVSRIEIIGHPAR